MEWSLFLVKIILMQQWKESALNLCLKQGSNLLTFSGELNIEYVDAL